ncbi:sigma-70 family RNA polymerase sigma factor [Marinobacter sp. BGYM27]|uniref:RNA polymerase sigma factor n=1 Tax=unclassified Marinobacter TaxID=83889 RepID=UPI0021A53A8A|nr:sigma-70 family RNA polymerase sigma factor [Marinobacter sp. BGYM27]MDG5500120.1 sigma-70 family RNA polymerase sigma factor [Marinobacter sp. BGYM27]
MVKTGESSARSGDESSLIKRLQAGEQAAFDEAVRAYTPSMLLVARFYLDPASAEDAVQEVWIKVVQAIQSFEGRASLKTWLHRIVANQAKDGLRKAGREIAMDFSEPLEPALDSRFRTRGTWSEPPRLKTTESAEQWLESGALKACLDKHLTALPEQHRSALMLYEAHQHKSEDVCNILGVSASNLRVILHRARQRIFLMVETFRETGKC